MMRQSFIHIAAWVVALTLVGAVAVERGFWPSAAQGAVGDLIIDWGGGVVVPDPIFDVTDMVPGQVEAREVTVTNGDSEARTLGVRGTPTAAGLADALDITVEVDDVVVYGASLLSQFFIDSAFPDALELIELAPGQTVVVRFTVEFNSSAENFFQGDSVVFDITLGLAGGDVDVPGTCGEDFEVTGELIVGTAGSDRLVGTAGNDAIFGLEGSDSIRGRGGDDCLVGGDDTDSLRGGDGSDLLFGGGATDTLRGQDGDDRLYGGSEGDSLRGGRGNDLLEGEEGDDSLRGGADDDELHGGPGDDVARGQGGTDLCVAEVVRSCEL